MVVLCGVVNWAAGQVCYTGFIDKYPIELVANVYSDGATSATYMYSNFDTPIPLNGGLRDGILTLNERDAQGTPTATLTFPSFDPKTKSVTGTWKNLANGHELPITLKKQFELNDQDPSPKDWLQSASMEDRYFRITVSSKDGYPRVSAVKVFLKQTDELFQAIELDCQFLGVDNVSVDDYNFDGVEDFAVFEASYAGANTSKIYFLYNPRSRHYYKSTYSGISLSFNQKTKTITESNQCCAGTRRRTTIYKVVDNKMVMVEEHCFRWDQEKGELVERPLNECN